MDLARMRVQCVYHNNARRGGPERQTFFRILGPCRRTIPRFTRFFSPGPGNISCHVGVAGEEHRRLGDRQEANPFGRGSFVRPWLSSLQLAEQAGNSGCDDEPGQAADAEPGRAAGRASTRAWQNRLPSFGDDGRLVVRRTGRQNGRGAELRLASGAAPDRPAPSPGRARRAAPASHQQHELAAADVRQSPVQLLQSSSRWFAAYQGRSCGPMKREGAVRPGAGPARRARPGRAPAGRSGLRPARQPPPAGSARTASGAASSFSRRISTLTEA